MMGAVIITSADTLAAGRFLALGAKLEDSNPDSAIHYYRLVQEIHEIDTATLVQPLDRLTSAYIRTLIHSLNGTGNIYYYDDEFMRSETYYRRSLGLAVAAGFSDLEAKAWYDIGWVRYVSSDYEAALDCFRKAFDNYNISGSRKQLYDLRLALGLTSRRLGDFDQADEHYRKGYDLALELGDSLKIADIGLDRGILLCEQGNLEEGMHLFEQALKYYEKAGNDQAVSSALLNIGVVMKISGEYEKALGYITRSTEMEEVRQRKTELVVRYFNLADLFMEMGRNDLAKKYAEKLEAIAGEIGSKPFLAEGDFLMGKYYFAGNDFPNAVRYLLRAETNAGITSHKPLSANISLWLAKARMKEGKPAMASEFAWKAFESAGEMNLLPIQKEAAALMAEAQKERGNPAEALKWLQTSIAISDSLDRISRNQEVRRIEARYNFEKKEKENELLRNRASLQEQRIRNRTIATVASVAGVLLSLVIIILLVKRSRDAHKLHRQQQMLNLQHLEALELEIDGKNRELTSKTMFLNQKNDQINRLIRRLQEIRDNSDNSSEEIVSIVNELRADAPQSSWKEFEVQFLQVHPGFYQRLYERHPELTSYEQRICAFLRMNLNTKEISAITGRSAKSIEVTRSRIRQKLNLKRDDNLSSFLAAV